MKDSILIYNEYKDRDLTYDVKEIEEHEGFYLITFNTGSGKKYKYYKSNILYIPAPIMVFDSSNAIVTYKEKPLKFDKIYKFNENRYRCIDGDESFIALERDLDIRISVADIPEVKRNFQFLYETSKHIKIKPDEDKPEIELSRQYDKIKFIDSESALSFYLSPAISKLKIHKTNFMIHPFGGNSSQDLALENALNKNITVIQGPPGTGKTQTILNIISNIIIQNKTALICSNNNSAIDNIVEKLSKENLDTVIAKLGSFENKKRFIKNQKSSFPKYNCIFSYPSELKKNIEDTKAKISGFYDKISELSTLKEKQQAFMIESRHFEQEIKENSIKILQPLIKKEASLENIEEISLYLEVKNPGFFRLLFVKIYIAYKARISLKELNGFSLEDIWFTIQTIIYRKREEATLNKIKSIEEEIERKEIKKYQQMLKIFSMDYLKHYLNSKNTQEHPIFTELDLFINPDKFLKTYPIVLSTTFSALSSIPKAFFDYIIMDEASQVDIATGATALSIAENAVIIGDEKQLPSIVERSLINCSEKIRESFKVDDTYSFKDGNSFLTSISRLLPSENITQLQEHYRCDPLIIGFCNKKFYNSKLKIMTDTSNSKSLIAINEVNANRGNTNLNEREIEEVKKQIEHLEDKTDIGIITPYREQANALAVELKQMYPEIEVDTVHKFQGREKNTIIISMVKSKTASFADEDSLINVAVSRAKKKLIVINSGNWKKDSNVVALMDYIKYTTGKLSKAAVSSVFDLLFDEEKRKVYFQKHTNVSKYKSETLIFNLIKKILLDSSYENLSFTMHYPMNLLIRKRNIPLLSKQELKYATNHLTHLDFLIYTSIDKTPLLAIEVDGATYHKEGSKQAKRDKMKDEILKKAGIQILRLRTDEWSEEERIKAVLDDMLKKK